MPWTGVNPPSVQPDYDPATKYEDPVAYFRQREAVSAERYVQVSEAKVRRGWPGRGPVAGAANTVRCCAAAWSGTQSTRPVSLQVLRRKLKECYRTEGIDHLSQCRTVRGRNDGVACLPGTCGALARRPWRHSCAFLLALAFMQLSEKYLEAIKGVGIYKANSGPDDRATWASTK